MAIRRLLAAVDLEQHSDRVIAAALSLGDRLGAGVTLVHVSESMPYQPPEDARIYAPLELAIDRYRTLAEEKLRSFAESLAPDVPVTTLVSPGRPVDYILKALDLKAYDMAIIGTHGRRGMSHALLGSNAARIVRSSPVPVMTVNTRAKRALSPEGFKSVILATDFSESAAAAEPVAITLAAAYVAELVIAHVIEERFHAQLPYHVAAEDFAMSYQQYLAQVQERYVMLGDELKARLDKQHSPVSVDLLHESRSVALGLAKLVERHPDSLLVLGTHGRGGLQRLLLGSVAEQVVRMSPRPVVCVRAA